MSKQSISLPAYIGDDVRSAFNAIDANLDDLYGANVVTETTTARTVALTDVGNHIRCSNASAVTVTVPPQADVAWTAGSFFYVEQNGTGQVTVAGGSGVTIRATPTAKTSARYGVLMVKRVASNEWIVTGDKAAS